MEGREEARLNDLFFVCSLIEYVARQTKNERKVIVKAMGHEGITHYLDLAEVYHCENIDKVTEENAFWLNHTQTKYDKMNIRLKKTRYK